MKPEYSLRLKIKRNDWLLVDTCLQAVNHCALFIGHKELHHKTRTKHKTPAKMRPTENNRITALDRQQPRSPGMRWGLNYIEPI